jgi:anti-sigma factor RsiW
MNSRQIACEAFADRLVDLSDGELAWDDRQRVLEHVAACPGCRAELARLDASLGRLRQGIVARQSVSLPERGGSAGASPSRRLHWMAAGAAGLAICLAGVWQAGPRITNVSPVANATPKMPAVPAIAAPKISQQQAFWHIALVEQQARLQMSLELMPKEAWYAEQREGNEQIVETLRDAARQGERL